MSSEVTVRRATLSDRQAVLDIDQHAYDGRAPLPSLYNWTLQNPLYRSYLAETRDGQVVSFMTLMVDPEEKFCVILAARTVKEYQSKGIIQVVVKESIKEMYADFGQIFTQINAASNKPVYSQRFWSDPNRTLIARHALLVYTIPISKIIAAAVACRTNPGVTDVEVEELSPNGAYRVLSDLYNLQHVLHKSHLMAFNNILPVPKTQKYLKQIAMESKVFTSFKNGSKTKASGISYSSILKGATHVNVNVFLSVYEDTDVLLAHLCKHLAYVVSEVDSERTVILRLDFPPEIDKNEVKEFLYQTLGENVLSKSKRKEYVLLWSDAAMPIKGKL